MCRRSWYQEFTDPSFCVKISQLSLHYSDRASPKLKSFNFALWPELLSTTAFADIDSIGPLTEPRFQPRTHKYDLKRHNLIDGVRKCVITKQETQIATLKDYMMKPIETDPR